MNDTAARPFPWAAIGLVIQIVASETEPRAFGNSTMVRYGLWAVAALIPLVCVSMRSAVLPHVLRRGPVLWLGAYLVWVVLAATWSVDPEHALQPALLIVSLSLYAIWYVSIHGWASFRRVGATGLSLLLAGCFVYQFANAPGERLRGFSFAPTNVGFLAGIATILGASLVRTRGRDRIIGVTAMVLGLSAVVASSTRTVAIGLVLAAAASSMRRLGRSGSLRASLILLVAVLAFIVAAGGDLLVVSETPDGTDFVSSNGGVIVLSHSPGNSEYTTGTGRTEVWTETVRLIRQRPLFGFGTGSAERVYNELAAAGHLRWLAYGAHNGVLGITVAQGVIGLGIFVGACLVYLRTARHNRDGTRSALLLLLFISSIGESLFDTGHLGFILLGACFAAAANDAVPIRRPASAGDRAAAPIPAFA